MLLWLFRGVYTLLIVAVTLVAFSLIIPDFGVWKAAGVASIMLLLGGAVLAMDLKEKNKQIATHSAIYFGLLMGLLLGWLFSLGIQNIIETVIPDEKIVKVSLIFRVGVTLMCCYVTISTLLQTKDEFRFIIPYVEFSKQVKGNKPLVLDTSVIIDGRIADVCDTRLVDAKIIVPRFVLQELQGIADSSDKLKRNRGRRGLDMLKRLQSNPKIELIVHDGNVAELRTGEKIRVDEKLVLFAKAVNGRVVTNDFNLNKMAQLQGVDVINLNEVANALKTVALPGEFLMVKVVKQGDQIGQGVGYLDDGTMVVIEQGRPYIGQDASILVTSVLQTPAGRMIFGRPEAKPSGTYVPVSGPNAPTSTGGSTSTMGQVPVTPAGTNSTQVQPAVMPGTGQRDDPSRGAGRS